MSSTSSAAVSAGRGTVAVGPRRPVWMARLGLAQPRRQPGTMLDGRKTNAAVQPSNARPGGAEIGATVAIPWHQPVADESSAEWLTLSEAAERLVISVDAVRRRMRRGDFQRRQVRTRHGLTWQVCLSPRDPGATLVPTVAIEPTVEALLSYLRDRDQQRDAEVAQLREDLARARADLVDQAMQLTSASEQLRALLAPIAAAAKIPALTVAERQELAILRAEHELHAQRWDQPQRDEPQRSWWRRLLG